MNPEGAYTRAARLIDLGRAAEAEVMLRQLLGGGLQEARVYTLLSMSLRLQSRYEESEQAARAALREDLENSEAHAELGRALLALGRDTQAVEEAREAVRLDPHSVFALHALVECAMHVSLPEAEAAAATIQRLAPHSALGSSLRAAVEMTRKRWPDAESWLREALRADPLSAASHANLALVLDHLGRREEARAEHQEAVRIDPQRTTPRQNLHVALRLDRVKGEAGKAPYSADLVGSTLAPAARAKGLCMLIQHSLQSGSLAEARAAAAELRDLLAGLELTGLDERRARVLGIAALARVEHYDDPRREVAMVAPLQEEAREVLQAKDLLVFLNNLGAAFLRAGDPDAIAAFQSVLALTRAAGNPNNIGMALSNLGAAYATHLREDEALRHYQECLELSEANGHAERAARVCCNLAQGCLRRGDVAGARSLVDRSLRWLEGRDEPALLAKVMVAVGGVELREGRLEAARRTLLSSLQAMRRGGQGGEVDGFAYLAEIAIRSGRLRLGALHLARAEERALSPQTRATVARTQALLDEARRTAGAQA